MNNLKNLLLVALFFITVTLLAQTKISGIVLDEIGQPLPGASVVEKGTSNGTSTDFDGKFMLNVKSNKGVAIVSFVGYKNSYINFTGGDLGKIKLSPDENKLEEIVITATSLAIDRKTPVAVSTLKAEEIERKLGSQEFVEVLKSTPGVYATKAGGGFGDGELRLRGFTSENVGVLINGVPVNDPGSGRVFWSNWAGLGDVTSLFQVQRGLGASKVAIPSIGGTLNIITKTTDVKKGGNVILGTGNNGYRKNGFTLSTGKMENDFAATVSVIQTKGDGFVDATPFNAVAYYGSLAYEFNEKHTLSLTSFGTPQEHGQRFNRLTVEQIRNAPNGIRFNSDVAIRNGEMELVSGNFFHKNQTSLNHYWNISDKSSLSTATYFSVGNGGAIFESGDIEYRLGNEFDPLDLDTEVQQNQELALQGLGSDVIINSSRNNHIWFGALSTFQTEINDKLDFLAGADYRNYTVSNFREVLDLLGGDFFEDDSDINNPNRKIGVGDKFLFNSQEETDWFGGFVQVEYSTEKFDAFISSSTSNTSLRRTDFFETTPDDPNRRTDKFNFLGYGIKGGVNYKVNAMHNFFGNLGYFERAPFASDVFDQNSNIPELINTGIESQKITSFELGYGLRSQKISANLNVYSTQWNDRTASTRVDLGDQDGEDGFVNVEGVDALHEGLEFDFEWRPTGYLQVKGSVGLGDWRWRTEVVNQEVFNRDQEFQGFVNAIIDDVKVADAAQTTAALGVLYRFWEKTSFTVDYNYFGDLYSDFEFDPTSSFTKTEEISAVIAREDVEVFTDTYKIPDYHTFDASFRHGFNIGAFETTVTLRVNNVFNNIYISEAFDSSGNNQPDLFGDEDNEPTVLIFPGAGRTWNLSAKIKF